MSGQLIKPILEPVTASLDLGSGDTPSSTTSWWINLGLGGKPKTRAELFEIFDYPWRLANKAEVLGRFEGDPSWHYVLCGEGMSDSFVELSIGYEEVAHFVNEALTESAATEILERVCQLADSRGWELSTQRTPAEVASRAAQLDAALERLNRDVVVVLRCQEPYRQQDLFPILESLGLCFGDGDMFHWTAEQTVRWSASSGQEDMTDAVELFGVYPPVTGYFSASGPYDELRFGFSVGCSSAPEHVLEQLFKAVDVTQSQLGGSILNAEGKPLDRESIRQQVARVSKEIQDCPMPLSFGSHTGSPIL